MLGCNNTLNDNHHFVGTIFLSISHAKLDTCAVFHSSHGVNRMYKYNLQSASAPLLSGEHSVK